MTAPHDAEPISRWADMREDGSLWLSASAVAVAGKGLLLLGASGTGKSRLALEMLALGGSLISDDGVWLIPGDDGAHRLVRPAQAPPLIEARGIGLLQAGPVTGHAPLAIVVDLDRPEPERLPPRRLVAIGTGTCPLIRGAGQPTLAAALMIMARHGRAEP